ncbi:MAG: prolipoprotein diacylglyceryl transferase [Candidatus Woesearchaeota archaeon]
MWIHNLNPTILNLGPLEIRWYGVVYVLGFFLTVWWMQYLRKKDQLKLTKDQIWDFAFYLMIGVLVGSRLILVVWHPQTYLFHPLNLLKIWEGGMSFHGGFVGIVLAGYWYCKKHKLNFLKIADVLSLPTIFALALGRIANFINGELWGKVWDGNWCVNFKNTGGGDVCRHPSQLYAASKRFLVFGWLLFLSLKSEFKPGFIFWNFVLFEGLGRIIVDFFKVDPIYFGFELGQWFSLIMVIVAVFVLGRDYRKEWGKLFK